MKKMLLAICMILTALTLIAPSAAGATGQKENISVLIDDLPVTFDVEPVMQNGRTLVPFRAVVEGLNTHVDWDSDTQTVTAKKGDTQIRLQMGSKSAYRNGNNILMDVPPMIEDGRTLIPLRFFAEAFDCDVAWNSSTYTVHIISPPTNMEVIGFYALGDANTSSWSDLFGRSYPQTGTGNTGTVSELALGWYSLDETGSLLTKSRTGWQRPDGWENMLKAADNYNLATEMVIHWTDQGSTINKFLKDKPAQDKAVEEIVKETQIYGGVNLDFEGLGWNADMEELRDTKNNFTSFIELLSGRLKEAGLNLTLTLHAPNSAYKGYDYAALGSLADRIIIMAYDYGSTPEPVNLVMQAVETAGRAVPPEKLVLGISAPSETAESIIAKVGIAKRYGLKGVALWRLGVIPGEMWDTLKKHIHPINI
ncbi:MAG: copper amine oxidase [Firmicutes bacterium]|nr:copper amine oxidase [Bacillota bacterium]